MNVIPDLTRHLIRNPSRSVVQEANRSVGRDRALVIGGSIAGLLAARILSERFSEVWILERDHLPDAAAPRKGTPQAVQPHGLLARGRQIMEELFPGFTDELVAQGALKGDIGTEVGFDADRRRFARPQTGCIGLLASRLAIEAQLRRQTRQLPNVTLLAPVDVVEPVLDPAAGRVTGVRLVRRTGAAEGAAAAVQPDAGADSEPDVETLSADLVVDCTGRGSRSPVWLERWGYEPPREQRVRIDLAYTSAYFEREPQPESVAPQSTSEIEPKSGSAQSGSAQSGAGQSASSLVGLISAATPGLPRPAVLLAQEPDAQGRSRWVLGVGGYGADQPDGSIDGMRLRAQAIGGAELIRIAEQGRLLGPVMRYRFPHNQRRHYERMSRFPAGYLVMGDALASFNPVYGQGMTVAACEALALREALRRGLDGVALRFFKAASKVIDIPWQMAVGGDLALPMVSGPRPFPVRLVNAYLARVFRAAPDDPQVAAAFLGVMHLLTKPSALMTPRVMWRVFSANRRKADSVRVPAGAEPARQLQVP